MNKAKLAVIFFWVIFLYNSGEAQTRVAKIFSDHMVLQQNSEVNVWGWANPGDTVSVTGSWNNTTISAVANASAKWNVLLPTPVATEESTPFSLTITGPSNSIVLKNILIGEVWLLSGQSNMEMPLQGWTDAAVEGGPQAIASANYPNIRLITITKNSSAEPQSEIQNSTNALWKECTPTTVRSFSAVGYFFGRELHKELNIPIGLVCSSWGGSSCETWTPEESLDFVNDYANKGPWTPTSATDNQTATVLYNGMIAPLVPFNFAGACWYQGETNAGRPEQLTQLFPAMIEGWRDVFQKENLPFYFVQLAPWNGYGTGSLPVFWEAQANALNLHDTQMAETLDCGDDENIHPAKKEPVGYRLAQKALANIYGTNSLVFAGPQFDSLQIENDKIRLFFSHTGTGLKFDESIPNQFEIAGTNESYTPASAIIEGNEILVWSSQVPNPKNVRYAWKNNAVASLYNREGFPAIPFRTKPADYIHSLRTTFISGAELIHEGESVELKWTSIGADEISLNDEPVSSSGEITVNPDTTASFTIKAINSTDSVENTKTVYVIPKKLNSWAKGKNTTASSFRTGYEPQKAVDEILNTGWSSSYLSNQWLKVDLGEVAPVNLVILRWGVNYGKKYEIQVSDDATDWTTIFTENNGDGGIDFLADLKGKGRYVRFYGISRSGSQGYDILEFNVYSTEHRQTGSLTDGHGKIMRGTPMVLGKNLPESVEFATNMENWETIKNNGFNTIRVCWVDPWYKNHGQNSWTVSEVLPYFDQCVENAQKSGMNIIINFHNVGAQQEFDTTYTFTLEKEFWDSIAPRYRDNDFVYYELANEPTFRMNDYLKPDFKSRLMEIYNSVRNKAPEREILVFSFNTIADDILEVIEGYKNDIDWEKTTVAYHMYNSTSSEAVQTIMAYHKVLCTEWNYDFVAKSKNWEYIKQVDGFKENAQTLENIGSGWIDWRDWGDVTLNELLDTLIFDARLKNYWWGEPVSDLKVSDIHISKPKIVIPSGKTHQLYAWILPALAENQDITWSTSNSNFASVDENGLITTKATQNKTATISAKSADGGFNASCEVEILAPEKKGAYPQGTPHQVPGTINSTHYDLGGEGVGYHDNNPDNIGNGIRQDQGVDTEFRLEEGSVGGIQNGEWLEYTVNAEATGYFSMEILFASPGRFGTFHIELDEENISGLKYATPSGSYDKFVPTRIDSIYFESGEHIIRVFFDFAAYNMGTIIFSEINTTSSNLLPRQMDIHLFPNPTDKMIFVSGSSEELKYSIQSLSGSVLKHGVVQPESGIDTGFLSKGNYILSLIGKNFVKAEKIIIL